MMPTVPWAGDIWGWGTGTGKVKDGFLNPFYVVIPSKPGRWREKSKPQIPSGYLT